MTDKVVHMPKPDRRVWVCPCGCRSFKLIAEGTSECSACDRPVDVQEGGWIPPELPEAEEYDGATAPFDNVTFGQDAHAVDLARRRVLSKALQDDTAVVVVAKADGTISAWSVVETKAQYKWLHRKMRQAAILMNPRARGYDREI